MSSSIRISYVDFSSGKLTNAFNTLHRKEALIDRGDGLIAPLGRSATFTVNPEYGIGRYNNTSGITFGDMNILDSSEDVVVGYPVAIKPVGPGWLAADEIRMANKLNSIGSDGHPDMAENPVTFRPMGALRDEHGRMCVITHLESPVKSFDNILQNKDKRPTKEQSTQALAFAAATLIFLHANGLVHLDYQVKNTATDGLTGRVIDITSMKDRKRSYNSHLEAFVHDFETYLRSVLKYSEVNGVTRGMIQEELADVYLSCIDDIFPMTVRQQARFRIEQVLREQNVGRV